MTNPTAYLAGRTARELATDEGVHESTVRRRLAEAGVALRRVGPRGRVDVATEEIVALRARGESWSAIAALVGMSRSGVMARWRAAMGLGHWR